jgi:hypothetical protein
MRFVGSARSTAKKRHAFRVLVRKPEEATWNKQACLEDTIKMCVKEI